MKIEAVVFDMDGVLIDAKEWHYRSLNRSLENFGYSISRAEHVTTYDGLPTAKKLEMPGEVIETLLTKDGMLELAATTPSRQLSQRLAFLPYKDSNKKTGLLTWAAEFGVPTVDASRAYREKAVMGKEILEEVARLMAQTGNASTALTAALLSAVTRYWYSLDSG